MQLYAHDLEIHFGQRRLFQIPQLQLNPGQRIWLRGANGAGKTTLLKILSGLQKPSRGRIALHGEANPPARWRSSNLLQGRIVYLHQNPYLFDGTVEENINYGLKQLALTVDEQRQRREQAIELAQLSDLRHSSAQVLSGGERQRLALARAWVLRPAHLLLDEPTASLDCDSIAAMAGMVDELQRQGCGLLLTSHQHTALTEACQQIWRLEKQQLICETQQELSA
ncbi:energy-coupling factor ABC transporter ATP-binding protein [Ferrimonas pelagia]|uniref:Energy-coupling factor ABC transporter ATP-binding protein n=1 Tax=Ferrimonas pelagia TaxID=1177826 RepID=A0ABP9F1R2_9GAMM